MNVQGTGTDTGLRSHVKTWGNRDEISPDIVQTEKMGWRPSIWTRWLRSRYRGELSVKMIVDVVCLLDTMVTNG